MNIQIFGTSKCFDTKKAQRYFKERGVKFQMIDLKEKEMSRGEFDNVARALGGWEKLVNPNAKDKQTLALLDALVDWQKEDKLFENQQLFLTPIVRNGRQATVGYQPDVWKSWDDASRVHSAHSAYFHKKTTGIVLHNGPVCGILNTVPFDNPGRYNKHETFYYP